MALLKIYSILIVSLDLILTIIEKAKEGDSIMVWTATILLTPILIYLLLS